MAKAKGTTLLSLVKFLRHNRDRALELLPSELHHYLEERIQTSGWYPEEDLLALNRCMIRLMPGQREAVLSEMGKSIAAEHMEGIYAHLRLEEGDLRPLARRAFALWSSQHDSGRLSVTPEGPGVILFELSDFGLPSREICDITAAYFRETLRLAGVEAEVREEECRVAGANRCLWRATWRRA
jgi:hypothetical protein